VLRPTLVYNCNNVPALCKNVRAFLGAATTATMHFDVERQRDDLRRAQSCPRTWISTPRANGANRCPEPDQPQWKWMKCLRRKATRAGEPKGECLQWENHGPVDAVMFQTTDSEGVTTIDNNRLAEKLPPKVDTNGNVVQKYSKLGAVLSCDEWPAAR
jgi:hypothetical protein